MFIIVAFESTHQALAVEKAVVIAGVPHETIPTPRNISANCGLSLKVPEQYLCDVQAIMRGLKIKSDVYRALQERATVYIRLESPKEG